MRIRGLDFSSSASSPNPLAEAELSGGVLHIHQVRLVGRPERLSRVVSEPCPWVLGVDFPFGLPNAFASARDWGSEWHKYVAVASESSLREAVTSSDGSEDPV